MQKRCIFRYILSDAWMQPISQIEVFEDEESGSVRGHLGWEPIFFDEEGIKKDSSFEIALNQSDIEQIKTLMIQYLVKFSDIELEITGVFDGVINFLSFLRKILFPTRLQHSISGLFGRIRAWISWESRLIKESGC